jgi:hypothetical protein
MLAVENGILSGLSLKKKIRTHNCRGQLLHHLPDVSILQALSHLTIVVDDTAADLFGSQGFGVSSH